MELDTFLLTKYFREWSYTQKTQEASEYPVFFKIHAILHMCALQHFAPRGSDTVDQLG